jgi:serine/threonine protein kinase
MTGRRILHYDILEKLGEGGMGVVYKARDTHLDRFVAIKVLPADKVADPERRHRFVQEARAASALNHPNIITVHDIAQADGLDFIVMEYVEGKTLDALIPRAGMRLGEFLKIGAQIARALSAAHGHGIVHRDLKPANVMVSPNGGVKVLDFGLAKLTETEAEAGETGAPTAEARTGAGVILGTAAYMSPEQAEGKPVDARSDIFSFGAVVYEMATGRRAFTGDSAISTLSAVLHQEPKPLEGLPHDLEKTILRCLRKDPAKRFQHMDDVCVALEELKEDSDSGNLRTLGAHPRRRVRLWAAIVASAGIVSLVAAWLVSRPGRTDPPPALVHVTSYPGRQEQPALSPDGSQVAFVWNGPKRDNYDIYVKQVGQPDALRLTTDSALDWCPVWSPDAKRIAFRRGDDIYTMSSLGGAERRLTSVKFSGGWFASGDGQMSWSPDGKWLALASPPAIVVIPTEGGEPRRVTTPEASSIDRTPAFSRDGRQLAYTHCLQGGGIIYLGGVSCYIQIQPLDAEARAAGAPRRVGSEAHSSTGLAWSSDGASFVLGRAGSDGFRLWQAPTDGRRPGHWIELAGTRTGDPMIAGDRLVFSRNLDNADIWRYEINGESEPLIVSTEWDGTPQYSPDGRRIAFESNRGTLRTQIWVADADGSGPTQLTDKPWASRPQWSPDGRWIAYVARDEDGVLNSYVIDAAGGKPRRVTLDVSPTSVPSFSRDGKWIYFSTERSGRAEVMRVPFGGGPPEPVTTAGGTNALESPDGRTLFYAKGYAVFARALPCGSERQILPSVRSGGAAFVPVERGVYFIGPAPDDKTLAIQFFDLAGNASRVLTKIEGADWTQGPLSISPDGKSILYVQSVITGSVIEMIENFR